MRIKYFAWLRERTGKPEETLDLPEAIATPADIIRYLKTLGEEYDYAFEHEDVVRVALDQRHAKLTDSLTGVHEVAFFPPMTGG